MVKLFRSLVYSHLTYAVLARERSYWRGKDRTGVGKNASKVDRTYYNLNTAFFNHSKTQKCYQIAYQIRLKIALPSLHSKNKLKATT